MNVTRTYDIELIRSVVASDKFWNAVTEDGQEKEYYEPNLQKYIWVKFENTEHEMVALIAVEPITTVTINVHAHKILKNTGDNIVEWFVKWLNTTNYQKVVAEVPETCDHVRKFVKWIGMNEEGVRTKSYLKNGELLDMHLYGSTRAELNSRFI